MQTTWVASQNCVSSTACSTVKVSPSPARKCPICKVANPEMLATTLPIHSRENISSTKAGSTMPKPMKTAEE